MTNDKAVYTIVFNNTDKVSLGAETMFHDKAEKDVLDIDVQIEGNVATVTVKGDSNAIPIYEEAFRGVLDEKYPSATLEVDVQIGGAN